MHAPGCRCEIRDLEGRGHAGVPAPEWSDAGAPAGCWVHQLVRALLNPAASATAVDSNQISALVWR